MKGFPASTSLPLDFTTAKRKFTEIAEKLLKKE